MRDGTNPCDHGRHREVRARRQREDAALRTHRLGAAGLLAALAAAVGDAAPGAALRLCATPPHSPRWIIMRQGGRAARRGRRQREALYTHRLGAVGRLAALAAAVGHTQATTRYL